MTTLHSEDLLLLSPAATLAISPEREVWNIEPSRQQQSIAASLYRQTIKPVNQPAMRAPLPASLTSDDAEDFSICPSIRATGRHSAEEEQDTGARKGDHSHGRQFRRH